MNDTTYTHIELGRIVADNILSKLILKLPHSLTQAQVTQPPSEEIWEMVSRYPGWQPISYWTEEGATNRVSPENVLKL